MFLWTDEHSRQMYTPKVTLDHVGLRALQSKHDYHQINERYCEGGRAETDLVALLSFEDFEDLFCFLLCGIGHGGTGQ